MAEMGTEVEPTQEGSPMPKLPASSDVQPKVVKTWEAEKRYRKLGFCLVLFLFSQLANSTAVAINHDIVFREPLTDLTARLVAEQPWGQVTCFLCTVGSLAFVLALVLCHRARWIIVRRWAFITATLYLFRAACLCATQLPPAFSDSAARCCLPSHHSSVALLFSRLPGTLFPAFTFPHGQPIYCGDSLFSGQILFILSNCYTFNYYSPKYLWPVRWTLILVASVGVLSALISRIHYSVDIIAAYVLTTGCYTVYHTFCEIPKKRRLDSSYGRVWMFWLMEWLEDEAPSGRIRNCLSWPFDRPLSLITKLQHWNNKCQEPCCRYVQFLAKNRIRTKL